MRGEIAIGTRVRTLGGRVGTVTLVYDNGGIVKAWVRLDGQSRLANLEARDLRAL